MSEYKVQIIGTIILFCLILVPIALAWLSDVGDSRPFNSDWVNEVRHATRGKAKQIVRAPLGVRTIQRKTGDYRQLVRRRFRDIEALSPSKAYLYMRNPISYLDSAAVVRCITTNLKELQPRNLHMFLDFIDGTVQWRVAVNG